MLKTEEILVLLAPTCAGSESITIHCMCKAYYFLTKEVLQEAGAAS